MSSSRAGKTRQPPANKPRQEGGKHPHSWESRYPAGTAAPAFPRTARPLVLPGPADDTSAVERAKDARARPWSPALPRSAAKPRFNPCSWLPTEGPGQQRPLPEPLRPQPATAHPAPASRPARAAPGAGREEGGGGFPSTSAAAFCSLGLGCFGFFLYTHIKFFKGEKPFVLVPAAGPASAPPCHPPRDERLEPAQVPRAKPRYPTGVRGSTKPGPPPTPRQRGWDLANPPPSAGRRKTESLSHPGPQGAAASPSASSPPRSDSPQ